MNVIVYCLEGLLSSDNQNLQVEEVNLIIKSPVGWMI